MPVPILDVHSCRDWENVTNTGIINKVWKVWRADSYTAFRPSHLGHWPRPLGWLHHQAGWLFPLAPLQYIWPIMATAIGNMYKKFGRKHNTSGSPQDGRQRCNSKATSNNIMPPNTDIQWHEKATCSIICALKFAYSVQCTWLLTRICQFFNCNFFRTFWRDALNTPLLLKQW